MVTVTELAGGWIATGGKVMSEILVEVGEFTPLLSNGIPYKAAKRLRDKEKKDGIIWMWTEFGP